MRTYKLCGLIAFTLSLNALSAQEPTMTPVPELSTFHRVELGARFMPTYSSFDVRRYNNNVVEGTLTYGLGWGGLIAVNYDEHIGLQGEVIYQELSQEFRDREVDHIVRLNYVNIPLLISLNTGKGNMVNLNFSGGPQVGINVGSEVEVKDVKGTDTLNAILAVKQGDFGFAYGAGLEFGFGKSRAVHLDIGFRGVFGLVDISDKSKSITTDEYYILDRAHVQTYAGYIGLTVGF